MENAGSRYVFVPASEFEAEGIGGWVARCAGCCPAPFQSPHLLPPCTTALTSTHTPFCHRITKVQRDSLRTTKITFKDADGKTSTHRFQFAHVLQSFKPLT